MERTELVKQSEILEFYRRKLEEAQQKVEALGRLIISQEAIVKELR